MRVASYAIDIEKPSNIVYHFSVDPGRMAEWLPDGDGQLIIDDGPLKIGSTFTLQRGEDGSKRSQFVYEVVGLEADSLVSLKSSGRLLTFTISRTFSEKSLKTTTVSDLIEMEDPPGLARLLGTFMMGRLKSTHHQGLQRLKNNLENSGE